MVPVDWALLIRAHQAGCDVERHEDEFEGCHERLGLRTRLIQCSDLSPVVISFSFSPKCEARIDPNVMPGPRVFR
jgi:hypothetical protein